MALFGDVDTVQELTDILVSDSASLLDVGSGLGDVLKGVTGENELVLLGLRGLDGDALTDRNVTDLLLTQEVSDLNDLAVLQEVDVDGEMGIDVSHLVLEALGDTNDHVVDKGLDGTQSSDVLSVTVEHRELDLSVGDLVEGDVDVSEVFGQGASWTGNGHNSGLDVNSDALRDVENFFGLDVLH